SSGPLLASADVSIPFTTGPATAGTTATISDQVSCLAELTCGGPEDVVSDANFTPGGSGLGTATGTTTISYKRTITNNSLCAAQGNASQNATTSKGVVNTGTATPGDNSGQSPQNAVATVTVTAGQCLTTGSDAPTSSTNNRTYKYTVATAADQ